VNPSDDPLKALARRLRALRIAGPAGQRITQKDLADALGASVPLISSWESTVKPTAPPEGRLEAYATFFATERSVSGQSYRVLASSELTEQEQEHRDVLLRELTALRDASLGIAEGAEPTRPIGGLWQFPQDQDITIVCSELPDGLRPRPFADPDNPDYVKAYRLSELDALIELYGHIRAVNPLNKVNIRTASELLIDDYTSHLAILGGVDWNPLTKALGRLLQLPVHQMERDTAEDTGAFEVEGKKFESHVRQEGGSVELQEDVAQFYRGPSPYNKKRTATICNGNYGRGTFGAVRALTDPRFRDRNEEYMRERITGSGRFNIVTRVQVINGEVVTPDWTVEANRLHEWYGKG
jgi:transcriptional regulator with XRE-family HTH domain